MRDVTARIERIVTAAAVAFAVAFSAVEVAEAKLAAPLGGVLKGGGAKGLGAGDLGAALEKLSPVLDRLDGSSTVAGKPGETINPGVGGLLASTLCKPLKAATDATRSAVPNAGLLAQVVCAGRVLDVTIATTLTRDGKKIQRAVKTAIGVPTPISVDSDPAPELIAVASVAPLVQVRLDVVRVIAKELPAAEKLPLRVELLSDDPLDGALPRRWVGAGFDTTDSDLPNVSSVFVEMPLLDQGKGSKLRIGYNQVGAKTFALVGGMFDGGIWPDERRLPLGASIAWDRPPATAKVTFNIDDTTSALTLDGGNGSDARIHVDAVEADSSAIADVVLGAVPAKLDLAYETPSLTESAYRMDGHGQALSEVRAKAELSNQEYSPRHLNVDVQDLPKRLDVGFAQGNPKAMHLTTDGHGEGIGRMHAMVRSDENVVSVAKRAEITIEDLPPSSTISADGANGSATLSTSEPVGVISALLTSDPDGPGPGAKPGLLDDRYDGVYLRSTPDEFVADLRVRGLAAFRVGQQPFSGEFRTASPNNYLFDGEIDLPDDSRGIGTMALELPDVPPLVQVRTGRDGFEVCGAADVRLDDCGAGSVPNSPFGFKLKYRDLPFLPERGAPTNGEVSLEGIPSRFTLMDGSGPERKLGFDAADGTGISTINARLWDSSMPADPADPGPDQNLIYSNIVDGETFKVASHVRNLSRIEFAEADSGSFGVGAAFSGRAMPTSFDLRKAEPKRSDGLQEATWIGGSIPNPPQEFAAKVAPEGRIDYQASSPTDLAEVSYVIDSISDPQKSAAATSASANKASGASQRGTIPTPPAPKPPTPGPVPGPDPKPVPSAATYESVGGGFEIRNIAKQLTICAVAGDRACDPNAPNQLSLCLTVLCFDYDDEICASKKFPEPIGRVEIGCIPIKWNGYTSNAIMRNDLTAYVKTPGTDAPVRISGIHCQEIELSSDDHAEARECAAKPMSTNATNFVAVRDLQIDELDIEMATGMTDSGPPHQDDDLIKAWLDTPSLKVGSLLFGKDGEKSTEFNTPGGISADEYFVVFDMSLGVFPEWRSRSGKLDCNYRTEQILTVYSAVPVKVRCSVFQDIADAQAPDLRHVACDTFSGDLKAVGVKIPGYGRISMYDVLC